MTLSTLPLLDIAGVRIQPYAYTETDRDGLSISARAVLTSEQVSQLKPDLMSRSYVSVTRVGIDAESRRMRFGLGRWSQAGENVRQELVLASPLKGDSFSAVFYPPLSFTAKVAQLSGTLDALVALLQTKGMLSASETDAFRDDISPRLLNAHYELYRVEDLDSLFASSEI